MKKPVLKLKWNEKGDVVDFRIEELEGKSADMLVNQNTRTSKPRYVPLSDANKYGIDIKSGKPAEPAKVEPVKVEAPAVSAAPAEPAKPEAPKKEEAPKK